jgi:hypothetical protein
VKVWTAHTSAHAAPVLVREGFSWGAALFGPFWLLAHRAWIAGVLVLCLWVGVALVPPPLRGVLELALAWLLGLCGRDLLRWSLARRGYLLAHVVAARNRDDALARLLDRRPDLISEALR